MWLIGQKQEWEKNQNWNAKKPKPKETKPESIKYEVVELNKDDLEKEFEELTK